MSCWVIWSQVCSFFFQTFKKKSLWLICVFADGQTGRHRNAKVNKHLSGEAYIQRRRWEDGLRGSTEKWSPPLKNVSMIQSSYYQTKEKIVLKCFTSFFYTCSLSASSSWWHKGRLKLFYFHKSWIYTYRLSVFVSIFVSPKEKQQIEDNWKVGCPLSPSIWTH